MFILETGVGVDYPGPVHISELHMVGLLLLSWQVT